MNVHYYYYYYYTRTNHSMQRIKFYRISLYLSITEFVMSTKLNVRFVHLCVRMSVCLYTEHWTTRKSDLLDTMASVSLIWLTDTTIYFYNWHTKATKNYFSTWKHIGHTKHWTLWMHVIYALYTYIFIYIYIDSCTLCIS